MKMWYVQAVVFLKITRLKSVGDVVGVLSVAQCPEKEQCR
jgi:hypothetical protein